MEVDGRLVVFLIGLRVAGRLDWELGLLVGTVVVSAFSVVVFSMVVEVVGGLAVGLVLGRVVKGAVVLGGLGLRVGGEAVS